MRITLAQLNTTVGDVAGNTRLILNALTQAQSDSASMLVCCELAISGSPPRDLLFRAGFVESCESAVRVIAERAGGSLESGLGKALLDQLSKQQDRLQGSSRMEESA